MTTARCIARLGFSLILLSVLQLVSARPPSDHHYSSYSYPQVSARPPTNHHYSSYSYPQVSTRPPTEHHYSSHHKSRLSRVEDKRPRTRSTSSAFGPPDGGSRWDAVSWFATKALGVILRTASFVYQLVPSFLPESFNARPMRSSGSWFSRNFY